jgi:hypothetical protein
MFDKLAPTPITEKKYRYLMIVAMVWMFTGAWVDASAHSFILDDIETFFTPWHALLYSGYGFVVISAVYVKNKMEDYKLDVGVLGASIFAIGGGSDAIWHTLLGIETGVEPLITPSHLMLFLGSFLMLDHVFASRPFKDTLDAASIFSIGTIYGLVVFMTQFLNPFLDIEMFFFYNNDRLAAGSVFFNAMLSCIVFVYAIRFKASPKSIGAIYLISFFYQSVFFILDDLMSMFLMIVLGLGFSLGAIQITNWYYKTTHDRKIQIASALIGSLYGLVVVVNILYWSNVGEVDLTWRFYGLGGLVTTPLLFGYMVGNLGVSPNTGEVVH